VVTVGPETKSPLVWTNVIPYGLYIVLSVLSIIIPTLTMLGTGTCNVKEKSTANEFGCADGFNVPDKI